MSVPFFRTGKIRIKPSNSKSWMEFKDIDFKFDISKPIGAVCMDAKISILGLSWDHIVAISTWTAQDFALAKDIRIQVFAGYGKDGYANCVFDGSIVFAMPTMPPNMWLNIQAISGVSRSRHVFDQDFGVSREGPVSFREYIKILCEKLGDKNPNVSQLTIPDSQETLPYFKGGSTLQDVYDALVLACSKHKAIVWEEINESGTSHFVIQNAVNDEDYTSNPDIFAEAKRLHTISQNTGMIGIPKVAFAEIEVTKFLDTSMDRGGFFYLETAYAPGDVVTGGNYSSQNGFYRINNIRHFGHLRGQEWYTTFKAWRWDDNAAGGEKRYGE